MSTTVKWFGHVNVNATDLAASSRFYREVVGLRTLWHTEPGYPQDGALFGLAGTPLDWRGDLLADHRGRRGPLLDLLEWTAPPTAAPVRTPSGGFGRLVFEVPSLPIGEGELELYDPDGTPVLLVGADVEAPTFCAVEVRCRSLEESIRYYRDRLGLTVTRLDERTAQAHLSGRRDTFRIRLVDSPGAARAQRRATQAGIYRLAMVVDRIDVAHLPPESTGVHHVELGSGLGSVVATLWPDPDGAVLEYVERGLGTTPASPAAATQDRR